MDQPQSLREAMMGTRQNPQPHRRISLGRRKNTRPDATADSRHAQKLPAHSPHTPEIEEPIPLIDTIAHTPITAAQFVELSSRCDLRPEIKRHCAVMKAEWEKNSAEVDQRTDEECARNEEEFFRHHPHPEDTEYHEYLTDEEMSQMPLNSAQDYFAEQLFGPYKRTVPRIIRKS